MKIRTKIMLLFIMTMVLVMGLSLVAAGHFGRKSYEEKTYSENERALNALCSGLEMTLEHIRSSSDAVFWNSAVQDKLSDTDGSYSKQAVYETITPLLLSDDAISSIIYFDENGRCTYSLRSGVVVNENIQPEKTSWYPRMVDADGEWIYETDSGGAISYTDGRSNVISMIRSVRSRNDYHNIGILMINIDDAAMRDILKPFVGADTDCCIFQGENYIFSLTGNKYPEISADPLLASSNSPSLITVDQHNKKIVSSSEFGDAGWTLTALTGMNEGLFIDRKLFGVTLVIAVLSIVLCWFFVTGTITHPLQKMTGHLRQMPALPEQSNHPDTKSASTGTPMNLPAKSVYTVAPFAVDDKKKDELTTMKKAYNHMLSSIDTLNEENRKAEQLIHEGEQRFLLSQLQPHFLYNTLDTISGMILAGDEDKAFKLVRTLSAFYRESMQTDAETARVEDEVKLAEDYLSILNMRYGDTIAVTYDIDPELMDEQIPRMILQPLIENAVHHGLRPKGSEGKILIRIAREKELLQICVEDDGAGMSGDDIARILNASRQQAGFGLFSIRQRLTLLFHSEEPLTIESEQGSYTKVTASFPAVSGAEYGGRDADIEK